MPRRSITYCDYCHRTRRRINTLYLLEQGFKWCNTCEGMLRAFTGFIEENGITYRPMTEDELDPAIYRRESISEYPPNI